MLVANHIFRRLRCPGCGLWTETAGWNTRQWHTALRSPWENLKCAHCHRYRDANGWLCTCGVLWFKCAVHNATHLEGTKPKRECGQAPCGIANKRSKGEHVVPAAMLEPQVRATRVRSRPMQCEQLHETTLNAQVPKRFRISLPHVLQLRFPYLAE